MRKVQVLLSSYNGEKFVLEQLDSIINQSGVDVNILVRDDGSTDRTVEIIENINNNKIKLLKSNNIGATKSFFEASEILFVSAIVFTYSNSLSFIENLSLL